MMVKSGITELLRRVYAVEHDERVWLEGICDGAREAFTGQIAVQAFTVEVTPQGVTFGQLAGDEAANAATVEAHRVGLPEDVRRLYSSGPAVSVRDVLANSKDAASRASHQRHMKDHGGIDTLAAMGINPSGRGCVLGIIHKHKKPSLALRTSVARVAGHLASSYRLRNSAEAPEALVSPTGEVLETSSSEAASHGAALRRAALGIDRAKRHEPANPEAALGYWKAMVEGRWSLVERFESDGRRILVARRNPIETREARALTLDELQVVSKIALCHPAKLVAYELGFSERKVSGLLRSSLSKLGLKHRAELVELYASLVGAGSEHR